MFAGLIDAGWTDGCLLDARILAEPPAIFSEQ